MHLRTINFCVFWALSFTLAFATTSSEATGASLQEGGVMEATSMSSKVSDSCRLKGFKLYGKVQVVENFPDLKVQIVNHFPDLKVQSVGHFPDDCGEWQWVENFPDLKVQFVENFPDIKIQMVQHFPGRP